MHVARKTGIKECFFRLLGSRSTNKSKDMNNIKILTWVKKSKKIFMMSDFTNFDFNFSKNICFVENDKKVPKVGFEAKKWTSLTLILL